MTQVFTVLGGLALFIYGVQLMGQGLQKAAGDRMRRILGALTVSPLTGTLVGAFVTAIIQSSSATTVMVVGFVNAGLMTLKQAVGVIFGANIGTTITAQLIAFKLTKYALPIVTIGFVMNFVGKRDFIKYLGQFFIGFGILFLGLQIMTSITKPLAHNESVKRMFIIYSHNRFLGVIIGFAITAIVQSSSATVGLVQTLAGVGLIDLRGAIPLILGDNIGTCVTALIASIGGNISAKRAAIAHIMFNIIGTLIVIAVLPLYMMVIQKTSDDPMRLVANAHSIFNIMNTLIFLPFAGIYARLIQKIIPGKERVVEIGPKFLDKGSLRVPPAAINQVMRELVRMLRLTKEMVDDAIRAFFNDNLRDLELIPQQEEATDLLQRDITEYLAELSQRQLSESESKKIPLLIHSVNDIERIGDLAENLMELAQKKINQKLPFSDQAMEEIRIEYEEVTRMIEDVLEALEKDDISAAHKALSREDKINELTDRFQQSHVKRLEEGICVVKSGLVFLDILHNFEKIGDHLTNIAGAIVRGM